MQCDCWLFEKIDKGSDNEDNTESTVYLITRILKRKAKIVDLNNNKNFTNKIEMINFVVPEESDNTEYRKSREQESFLLTIVVTAN